MTVIVNLPLLLVFISFGPKFLIGEGSQKPTATIYLVQQEIRAYINTQVYRTEPTRGEALIIKKFELIHLCS